MTDNTESTGPKQRGRPFRRGESGNPAGRPKGARHTALLALDAIGAEGAAAVMQTVVKAAQGGDMRAAEILLRRLWPERKGRPISMDLPTMETSADLAVGLGAVTSAVALGDLSPEEGAAVAAIMEAHRRAIETVELEARIAKLESK